MAIEVHHLLIWGGLKTGIPLENPVNLVHHLLIWGGLKTPGIFGGHASKVNHL